MTLKKTLLLLIILMLLFGWLGTQEKEKNKNQLVEKMKITHTVIPVRVYKGDMIVGGLKKTDFKLYEN